MSGQPDRGTIRISNMRFWGKHGATEGERDWIQPIDVDIEIAIDVTKAAASDALADTVDYGKLHAACKRVVKNESYALLEALADRIAATLCEDPKVIEVAVRVRKPRFLEGATPEVELRRVNGRR